MHDVHDMDYDTIGLSERIDMLNEDQRRIFDQVADHLKHDCDDCQCRDLKPPHMFVVELANHFCLPQAVSCHHSICSDYSQVPGTFT